MTESAIEATGLRKSYDSTTVLHGIELTVATGTVFCLLGPNGAGKTTTVRILTTLTALDGGSARVAGADVIADRGRVRERISLTGQYAALDELQSGFENLQMMGRLRGLSAREAHARALELLAQFELEHAARRRTATYSGGMRRRLDLAASLVRAPQVLFLDEPTTGLDPRSRRDMWSLVGDLTSSGVTVFLTTQYLEEADRLADRVAVMDRGTIVAEGTPAQLKATVTGERLDLTAVDRDAYNMLEARLGSRAIHRDASALTLGAACQDRAEPIRALLGELDPAGGLVDRFSIHTASLDDVFMALTGRGADPESEPSHD
ncbi:MAG: ATP-binding cassette domain-containing protein [Solirubrobacteraceae bacterium]